MRIVPELDHCPLDIRVLQIELPHDEAVKSIPTQHAIDPGNDTWQLLAAHGPDRSCALLLLDLGRLLVAALGFLLVTLSSRGRDCSLQLGQGIARHSFSPGSLTARALKVEAGGCEKK